MTTTDVRAGRLSLRATEGIPRTFAATFTDGYDISGGVSVWVGGSIDDPEDLTGAIEVVASVAGQTATFALTAPDERGPLPLRMTVDTTVIALGRLHISHGGVGLPDQDVNVIAGDVTINIEVIGSTAGGVGTITEVNGQTGPVVTITAAGLGAATQAALDALEADVVAAAEAITQEAADRADGDTNAIATAAADATAKVNAEALLARDAGNLTSGTIGDGRIPAGIARDSEVASLIAAEVTARDLAIATAISNLVAGAPGLIDTLDELAAALGDDPNFAATMTTQLAGKQTAHANLSALSGITGVANLLPYFSGAGALATTTLSSFGRALIDDADATAMQVTLGLGSLALQAASNVTITGGAITGITDMAVADGGTGASTAAAARANLLAVGTTGNETIGGQKTFSQVVAIENGFLGLHLVMTGFNGIKSSIDTRSTRADTLANLAIGNASYVSQIGDVLGAWHVGGSHQSTMTDCAQIYCIANQTFDTGGTAGGTRWVFYTEPDGTVQKHAVLTIMDDGAIVFGTPDDYGQTTGDTTPSTRTWAASADVPPAFGGTRGTQTFQVTTASTAFPALMRFSNVYELDHATTIGANLFKGFWSNVTIKNKSTRDIGLGSGATIMGVAFNDINTIQVDTATGKGIGIYNSFRSAPTFSITTASGGTITTGATNLFSTGPTVGAGVTLSGLTHVAITDVTNAGTVTTQTGISIPAFSGGSTNIGITNGSSLVQSGVSTFTGTVTITDVNIVLGTTTGTKIGTGTTQKLGFFNATPIVQPSAYTQTFATADKTHAARTSSATSETTATNITPWGYATQAQANAVTANLNAVRADLADTAQLLNALIDDLQTLGLVA